MMKTKHLSKGLLSMLLTLVMVLGTFPAMAYAAEDASADQQGTFTTAMLHENQDKPSMCDVMFAEKAEVEVHGDNATLKLYVAYPVPAFPDMGKDGTVKDFKVTYNGQIYTAESDIASKPMMTVKTDNPGFGLKKGAQIPAQVLTLTLPKTALEESVLPATAFVNVFMFTNVNFRMSVTDLVWDEPQPEPEKPEPEKPEPQKPEPQKPEPEKPEPDHPAVDIEDKETGIRIYADENVFTEEVSLVVTPIHQGDEGYDAAAKVLDNTGKKFQLFEIHFENQKGETVQPNSKVSVSYPIPTDYNVDKLAVYRINEDGTKTRINGSAEGSCFTVVQKSFSTYALVEEGSTSSAATPIAPQTTPTTPSAPQTGDATNMAALISLMVLACAAVTVMLLGKKRSTVK